MIDLFHSESFWVSVAFFIFIALSFKKGKRLLLTSLDSRIENIVKNINPPLLGFNLLNNIESQIKCYPSHNIEAKLIKLGDKRIEVRFNREFPKGRTRINCTTNDNGKWRWTGFQFLNP